MGNVQNYKVSLNARQDTICAIDHTQYLSSGIDSILKALTAKMERRWHVFPSPSFLYLMSQQLPRKEKVLEVGTRHPGRHHTVICLGCMVLLPSVPRRTGAFRESSATREGKRK